MYDNSGRKLSSKKSSLSSLLSTSLTSLSSTNSSTNAANGDSNHANGSQWLSARLGAMLFNSGGQLGYHCLPASIADRLFNALTPSSPQNCSSRVGVSSSGSDATNERRNKAFETVHEMIFGSVALNLCSASSGSGGYERSVEKGCSPILQTKLHKLCADLLMTSFIFQCEYSNGKTLQRQYGLALIWDLADDHSDCESDSRQRLLRQYLLNESTIIDSIVGDLIRELIVSRMRSQKDIHVCVAKSFKTINDYLSVCKLSSTVTTEQFIDDFGSVIDCCDTKSTNLFVSTLVSTVLMFRHKYRENRNKLRVILWTKDARKVSLITQLLLVINQFLNDGSLTKTRQLLTPSTITQQQKTIKFCRRKVVPLMNGSSSSNHSYILSSGASSSVSTIATVSSTNNHNHSNCNNKCVRNSASERKSRDESLGYESLTESGSATTSTICESGDFSVCMTISGSALHSNNRTSTPLSQDEESTRVRHQSHNDDNADSMSNATDREAYDYYGNGDTGSDECSSPPQDITGEDVVDCVPNNVNSDSVVHKSQHYFREYRNLRFTACPTTGENSCDTNGDQIICTNGDVTATVNGNDEDNYSEDSRTVTTSNNHNNSSNARITSSDCNIIDVESIRESMSISGFGECSMPDLQAFGASTALQATPYSITNNYLLHQPIQGIISSKTIANYDQLLTVCGERLSVCDDSAVIACDVDAWRVSVLDARHRAFPAIMSTSVSNLCETVSRMRSLRLNAPYIRTFISRKLNELMLKSFLLKCVLDANTSNNNSSSNSNNCSKYSTNSNSIKRCFYDNYSPLSVLIADSFPEFLSPAECSTLGFDVSDIPLIIALRREEITSNSSNSSNGSCSVSNRKLVISNNNTRSINIAAADNGSDYYCCNGGGKQANNSKCIRNVVETKL